LLIETASRVDNYFYLPFWFEIREDGKVISYHINCIPKELKDMITEQQKSVDKEPTRQAIESLKKYL
jgi:hypothetical protein